MTYAIGFDIGGTKIAAGLFDKNGNQRAERIVETPKNYDAFLKACATLVKQLESEANASCSIGLGLPGLIDHANGTLRSANVSFLNDLPLVKDLSSLLGCVVKIANDANCMALAEAKSGAGREYKSVLGLIIGTGVGSGYVLDGKIVNGVNGFTGEIGHLPLPFYEEGDFVPHLCGCGQKHCIESAISGPALSRLYTFKNGGENKTAVEIAQEAKEGSEKALTVLDQYFTLMAKSFITAIYSFDPEIIVISGGLNNLPNMYETVTSRLGSHGFIKNPKTKIVKAVHGPMAGLHGAAWLARSA